MTQSVIPPLRGPTFPEFLVGQVGRGGSGWGGVNSDRRVEVLGTGDRCHR